MVVLIPSYQPDARLVRLVESLVPIHDVVVVDDGSGESYARIFDEARAAGADVLVQPVNRGKGAALKVGFRHVLAAHPGAAVVCADSDGQHTPADITAVAEALVDDETMVLGVRAFTGTVPLRSRLGNLVTAKLFGLVSGHAITDTQTGLRAYPHAMLPWLCEVPGERFEYELSLLLQASGAGWRIAQVPIATIYLDENSSSHFRPVRDSLRIYGPLLCFGLSSASAAIVDWVALLGLQALTGNLLVSVVGARLISSSVNYATNARFVFDSQRPARSSALRYFALVVAILAGNYLLLSSLVALGLGLVWAKAVTELVLFAISWTVQRRVVFRAERPTPDRATTAVPQRGLTESVDDHSWERTMQDRPTLRLVPAAR